MRAKTGNKSTVGHFQYPAVCRIENMFGYVICHCNVCTFEMALDWISESGNIGNHHIHNNEQDRITKTERIIKWGNKI